jgi:hypothetical protein
VRGLIDEELDASRAEAEVDARASRADDRPAGLSGSDSTVADPGVSSVGVAA